MIVNGTCVAECLWPVILRRSEGPMYCACTIRSFCTSLVTLSDFVMEFLGHEEKASQRANNSHTNFRSRETPPSVADRSKSLKRRIALRVGGDGASGDG